MEKDISKGYTCPHCHSFVKRYKRKLNSNMAICLILLYRHAPDRFVKVEDFLIKNGRKRCGDFSYLVHYKFLEKEGGLRKDGSNRTGYYRITGLGMMFVEEKAKAHQFFFIQNNKFQGFEGPEIKITDALGDKFNYDELMNVKTKQKEQSHNPLFS